MDHRGARVVALVAAMLVLLLPASAHGATGVRLDAPKA
jgi:hypothetical protein